MARFLSFLSVVILIGLIGLIIAEPFSIVESEPITYKGGETFEKSYDEKAVYLLKEFKEEDKYGEIAITYLNVSSMEIEKVMDISLKNNTDVCGKECFAIGTIRLLKETSLIDDVRFYRIDGKNTYLSEIRSYKILILDKEKWIEYDVGKVLPPGNYTIKLLGYKKPSWSYDWQIKTNGFWTTEWAVWGNISDGDDAEVILQIPANAYASPSTLVNLSIKTNVTGGAYMKNLTLYTNESGSWTAYNSTIRSTGTLAEQFSTYTNTASTPTYVKNDTAINNAVSSVRIHGGNSDDDGYWTRIYIVFFYTNGSTYETGYQQYQWPAGQNRTYDNPFPYEPVSTISYYMWRQGDTARLYSTSVYGNNEPSLSASFLKTYSPSDTILWNAYGCDSDNGCGFAPSNFTFSISDVTINILSPATSVSSATIVINNSINTAGTLDVCYYNITRGASTEKEITYLNCSQPNATYTLSGEATYNLWVFANTTTGLTTINNLTFVYSAVAGTTPSSGGGGGSLISSITGEIEPRGEICKPFRETLISSWKEKENENIIARIQWVWNNWWNFAICGSASSIIPI